jgi:putative acetyltransferase
LREAVDGDSWAVMALICACWAEYPGCITDVAGEYPEFFAVATHFRHVEGRLWVLPEGHWVAASVGMCPGGDAGDGPSVELVKLYVAPHRRGHGIGAALVGVVEQHARDQDATEVRLWSDSRFQAAHRLYQRLGYQRSGADRDLHDLSHTVEHEFRKPLPPQLPLLP